MSYLIINGIDVSDLVKGLKVGYETLVSEDSGRNAAGDTVLDIVNKKVKLVPIKVNIHARNASIFHTQIFSYHMQNHSDLCFCVHRISYIMLDIFMLKYYNNYIIIAFFHVARARVHPRPSL